MSVHSRFLAGLLLALHCSSFLLLAVPSWTSASPLSLPEENLPQSHAAHTAAHAHAPHIFNAVHSALRQWGSSLQHNGLSFFLARVPAGVELYHGTTRAGRIQGPEWLAFEAEHALNFARARGPPGRGPGGGPGGPPGRGGGGGPPPHGHTQAPFAAAADADADEIEGAGDSTGYLHTFVTKRPLRLLYLDGQSAAKSSYGTLDTQDVVLRNRTDAPIAPAAAAGHPHTRGGPMGENERAQELCALAAGEWAGRVDGFLRMEGGFEVILCERDFGAHLHTRSVQDVTSTAWSDEGYKAQAYAYYQAIASRFDGIGGQRVALDWGRFVSMFALPGAVYFDGEGRPRAVQDDATLNETRRLVREMVMREDEDEDSDEGRRPAHPDWQAVVDMYVGRYSDRIEHLASLRKAKDIVAQAKVILRPFIDFSKRDRDAEVARCAAQYWPAGVSKDGSVPAQSVHHVVTRMCTSIWEAWDAAAASGQGATGGKGAGAAAPAAKARQIIEDLRTYLSWTTWKRCRGCQAHELCKLPIWPMGDKEDFEQPRCSADFDHGGRSYWQSPGPRAASL